MKDKSIEILEEDKCSGCSACLVICPTNAISMHNNGEGFLYPKVNYTLCTNCGLCSKICPELEFYISPNNEIPEECYSMQSNDSIRMQGASGGMFALVANYILDFGIKLILKVDEKQINKIAWWIPIKRWRDNFRAKFTRPDQTRLNYCICSDYIYFYHNSKYKKLQPMPQYKLAA